MRRKLLPLLLTLFAAGVGYAAYWYSLADDAGEIAAATRRMLAGQGIDSDFDWQDAAGFPYRLRMSSDPAALEGHLWPVDWSLRAGRLDIVTQPWTPDHFVALITGLDIGLGNWRLRASDTRASLVRNGDGPRVDADLGAAKLQTGSGARRTIDIGHLQFHLRRPPANNGGGDGLHPGTRWQAALLARDIATEAAIDGLPPDGIGRLTVEMSIYGPLNAPFDRTAIAAWRDAGGIIEIDSFALSADGMSVTGSGSLTLDDAFRPIGVLTLSTATPKRLIVLLAELGAITPDAAPLAWQAVDAAIAAAGKGETVNLPFTLQDGRFQLAGLGLNIVPPLD